MQHAPRHTVSAPEDRQGHGGVSAAAPSTATTLDATALSKLRELDPDGQLGVLRRVLTIYHTTLLQALQELTSQLSGGRTAEVTRIAHKLKSSSASVGALALALACGKVEQDVRSGTSFELRAAVQWLLDEGHAALAAVEAMLRR